MEVIWRNYCENDGRQPTAFRWSREGHAVASLVFILTGSSGSYDKLSRVFNGALPLAQTVKKNLATPLAPTVDGFQFSHFVRIRAILVHEIAVHDNCSEKEAKKRLKQMPLIHLSSDETAVAQGLVLARDRNLVFGLVRDYEAPSPTLETVANQLSPDTMFADYVEAYIFRLVGWPRLPSFLIAGLPTSSQQRGVTAEHKAAVFRDLIPALRELVGLQVFTNSCDGKGQPIQNVLRQCLPDDPAFKTPPLLDLLSSPIGTMRWLRGETDSPSFQSVPLRFPYLSPLVRSDVAGLPVVAPLHFRDVLHLLVCSDGPLWKEGVLVGTTLVSWKTTVLPLIQRCSPLEQETLAAIKLTPTLFNQLGDDRMCVRGPELRILHFSKPAIRKAFVDVVQRNASESETKALEALFYLLDAYRDMCLCMLQGDLPPLKRLEMMFRGVSRLELLWLFRQESICRGVRASQLPSFTGPSFVGFTQNAQSLAGLLFQIVDLGWQAKAPLCLHQVSSQPCEDHFRGCRGCGNDCSFNLAEFFRRSSHIHYCNLLGAQLSLTHHKKSQIYDSVNRSGVLPAPQHLYLPEGTTVAELVDIIARAKMAEVGQFKQYAFSSVRQEQAAPRGCSSTDHFPASVSGTGQLTACPCGLSLCPPCWGRLGYSQEQLVPGSLFFCGACTRIDRAPSNSPTSKKNPKLRSYLHGSPMPDVTAFLQAVERSTAKRLDKVGLKLKRLQPHSPTILHALRLLYPNLAWNSSTPGPRPKTISFGGSARHEASYLAGLTVRQKESRDRIRRVQKRPLQLASGARSSPKRLKETAEDSDTVLAVASNPTPLLVRPDCTTLSCSVTRRCFECRSDFCDEHDFSYHANEGLQLHSRDSLVVTLACCGFEWSEVDGAPRIVECTGCLQWVCFKCERLKRNPPQNKAWLCSQCKRK